ncbi:MAG: SGNH/GDSL hydrolase family protein [Planctomycetes bacterium]|nr:SGNH/GDSL hydrolase family protein [Planctomycetota bacterium]
MSLIRYAAGWLTVSLLVLCVATAQADDKAKAKAKTKKKRAPNLAMQPIDDVAGLPRVLLIGDSISIGYTVAVREELKGKANVHRPLTNCGPTIRGIEQIDRWLGDKKWDVIHFNWGLHDLKYMGADGKNLADPKDAKSHQQVPPDEYEKHLRTLVARMKKTGATLIWCSTTPVPEGAAGRVVGDSVKYNEVAAKVMKENDVATDDLYTFSKSRLAEIQLKANVHFSGDGSKTLAKQVAKSINAALGSE